MRDLLATVARLLRQPWRQDRGKMLSAALLVLAGSVSWPLTAVSLRWVVDAVIAGRSTQVVAACFAVGLCTVAGVTFITFAHVSYYELCELHVLELNRDLIALSNGSATTAHHDDPRIADDLTLLEQQLQELRMGFEALLSLAALFVASAVTAVLLAAQNPLLLLLPLATVPPLLTGRRAERIIDEARTASASDTRRALSLFHLASSAAPAKELRVFRLRAELLRRHRSAWDGATRRIWHGNLLAAALNGIGQFLFAAGYLGAVLLVLRGAVDGHRSVGDVVLVITLAVHVNHEAVQAVALVRELQRVTSTFRRLERVRSTVEAVGRPRPASRVPPVLRHGIELSNVTYHYPGADRPTLRAVDLFLPAGRTVAVVGENGAGKSTLVKLLCGLDRPTSGTITVDGTELSAFPPEQWWRRTTGGFQDFVRFELPMREVVGLGDVTRPPSDAAVRSALAKVRAEDLADRLPGGLDAQLGTSYTEGAELSGGQWQKLAVARAFMRRTPLLLVLDEPTSALDADAEQALLDTYAEQAARIGRTAGGVTVLISHRLSTVRMADLIVVMSGGQVAETGSHDELTAAGGLYAELYKLQAQAYRRVRGVPPAGHPTAKVAKNSSS